MMKLELERYNPSSASLACLGMNLNRELAVPNNTLHRTDQNLSAREFHRFTNRNNKGISKQAPSLTVLSLALYSVADAPENVERDLLPIIVFQHPLGNIPAAGKPHMVKPLRVAQGLLKHADEGRSSSHV